MNCRSDWTREEIQAIYDTPLLDLIYKAASVHREHHRSCEIQVCALISVKTGGCPEDCKYCPQSSKYQTHVTATPFMQKEQMILLAKEALSRGATRVCLGAAQSRVKEGKFFDELLMAIKEIHQMGVEVCCTLGMLNEGQAMKLKEAGLYAYNHNLDTSREFYPSIITTRLYDERLKTLDTVEKSGISVCCGGIIGMGESIKDRLGLLRTLASRNPHPESIPINQLIAVKGTALEKRAPVSIWEMVRMIATTRLVCPQAMIRLSAGRLECSLEGQALCFLAGANSIFSGEKLLTCPNPDFDADLEMMHLLGLQAMPPFSKGEK